MGNIQVNKILEDTLSSPFHFNVLEEVNFDWKPKKTQLPHIKSNSQLQSNTKTRSYLEKLTNKQMFSF